MGAGLVAPAICADWCSLTAQKIAIWRPGRGCAILGQPFCLQKSNLEGFLNSWTGQTPSPGAPGFYACQLQCYAGLTEVPQRDPAVDTPSASMRPQKGNELMAHAYSHCFAFPPWGCGFLRCTSLGRPDMAMWLFAEAMLQGRPIKVFNYGKMQRDFTILTTFVQGWWRR